MMLLSLSLQSYRLFLEWQKKMETFLLISSIPSGKSSLLQLDFTEECHAPAR